MGPYFNRTQLEVQLEVAFMEMGRRIRKHHHIAGMFNFVVARFCTTGISSIFDGPDSSIPTLVWYDGLIMIVQP